jgi:hypothetical protein
MDTAVEIRNPNRERVRELIDVTHDARGNFHLTVKEGGEFSAKLLSIALREIPSGEAAIVDTRPCRGLDESLVATLISYRNGSARTLHTTEAGIEKLVTMRLIDRDGTPSAGARFSWRIEKGSPETSLNKRPAKEILEKLAEYLQEQEKPIERATIPAPRLEQLINVTSSGDTVTVTVIAPIRGDHGQLLQDYLQDLGTDKKIVVNLKDLDPDATAAAYCVLMAAKLRKKDGAEPIELQNVPSSLTRVFNPAYSSTLGFALASVG